MHSSKQSKIPTKIVLLLIPVFLLLTGFFSLYQSGNMKNDGSGSMNVIYSGTIQQVVDNKYSLGNFPFGEKNVREYFSSDNITIKKLQIAKPGDTAYMVILDLDFKNFTDLTKLKGFSDMNLNLTKVDTGTEFKWTIKSNERTKLLNVLNFSMTFESEIFSTNGVAKDGNVKWYKSDFSKENILSVILKSDIANSSSSKNSESKDAGNKDKGNKDAENKNSYKNDEGDKNSNSNKKLCGLIGIELPLIMFAGFVYSYKKRYKY